MPVSLPAHRRVGTPQHDQTGVFEIGTGIVIAVHQAIGDVAGAETQRVGRGIIGRTKGADKPPGIVGLLIEADGLTGPHGHGVGPVVCF